MGSAGMAYLLGWIVLGAILYAVSARYRNAVPEEERVKVLFQK